MQKCFKPLLGIVLLAVVVAPGCASKGYVGKEVGTVNEKVESLSESVEQNQERIRQAESELERHESEIGRVDAKADEAGTLAGSAKDDAAQAMKAAQGKLIYEVTLSNDVAFDFGATTLSDDAKVIVDDLAQKVKADNRGLYLEIEGHTDATGDESYNERLGLLRSEEVRDYLYQTHGIPLHRIAVYSFGESQPIADNSTREGRARNRRVVIKVLE
jgi:outer membrane protein OmpA-like peptidoglycan-associated protein